MIHVRIRPFDFKNGRKINGFTKYLKLIKYEKKIDKNKPKQFYQLTFYKYSTIRIGLDRIKWFLIKKLQVWVWYTPETIRQAGRGKKHH